MQGGEVTGWRGYAAWTDLRRLLTLSGMVIKKEVQPCQELARWRRPSLDEINGNSIHVGIQTMREMI